jgi:hypothetical protein
MRPDPKIAAEEASNWNLRSIEFHRIHAEQHLPRGAGPLDWRLLGVPVQYVAHAKQVRLLVPFELEVFGSDEKVLVGIGVALQLDYELTIPPSSERALHAAGILGVMHAWPYFRSEVQSLSAKVGLPALTMPTVLSGAVPKWATVHDVSDVAAAHAQRSKLIEQETPTAKQASKSKRARSSR